LWTCSVSPFSPRFCKVEVRLSAEQRAALERLVRTGTPPAHATRRARILLKADAAGPDAWPDERIAQALDISRMTVSRARAQFAAEGLDATLHKKKAEGRQYRELDGAPGARLIALACSRPPTGRPAGP
jgi:biotin operon repressor